MKGYMIMKNKFTSKILLAVASFIFLASCDKIDQPLVIIDEQYSTDSYLDTLYFKDSVYITDKHVLLEDFTGHKCVNCPEAALAAHELAEELNHKLIIYSIHAGYYAEPDETGNYTADFRCPTGDELYNDFQAFANPIGLIDRVEYNGSVLIGAGNWETVVLEELDKPNTVDLNLRNIYYPNLNKVQIDVLARFYLQPEGKYKLVVYIVEDGIVSPQKNNNPNIGPSPDWLDYVHRNILRSAVNSTYGSYVSSDGSVIQDEEYHNQFILDMNANWVTANCNIIAYILSENTGEVLQVAELGIKTTK
jgi:thiol-disulfide isomerase/thioredoxin